MADREICERWKLVERLSEEPEEDWSIEGPAGIFLQTGEYGSDIEIRRAQKRTVTFVPLEVLAECLRLSGYDVTKRESEPERSEP